MSLFRNAKTYIANQTKYAHLNAFISRVDLSVILDRPTDPEPRDGNALRDNPIAIKDNICTEYLKTTAASGILKDFTSPYDATVVKLLRDAGAVVVGKTNMDEFGMGSHSTHSHAGPVKMQRYEGEERSAGGSSGGSALAVASAQCWAALGTDTGGSVRLPAAYTGVVGFKPSYGLLSRWGVIAYANSLDAVGIFARNARIVEDVFDRLNVHDPQDPTSLPPSTRARLSADEQLPETLRIGVPLDYNIATLDPTVRGAWMRALRALSDKGHTLHPVRLPATQQALSAYYVLAPAEASSNLAKYDGVRFGSRAEGVDGTPESVLFAKTRGQGFGPEVQRRILLGAFSLSAEAIDNYFIQAQKVRRLVQQDFDSVFAKPNPLSSTSTPKDEGVDFLLCPTAPTLAPSFSDVQNQHSIDAYTNDVFTVPASLAGLPAISVPIPVTDSNHLARHGKNDIAESAGIQLIGQYGDDKRVLKAAWDLQRLCPTIQRNAGPHMTAWGDSSLGDSTVNQRKQYGGLAMELGVTIAEAIPIAQARFDKNKERVGNLFDVKLGAEHLDNASRFSNLTRAQYISKFANEEDPLAAEETFHDSLMAWRQRVDATKEERMRVKSEEYHEQKEEKMRMQMRRRPSELKAHLLGEAEMRSLRDVKRLRKVEDPWQTKTRGVLRKWGDKGRIRFVGIRKNGDEMKRTTPEKTGMEEERTQYREEEKSAEKTKDDAEQSESASSLAAADFLEVEK